MAEGASALSEDAFPTQNTSLNGAAGKTAVRVLTGGGALTEETPPKEDARQTGEQRLKPTALAPLSVASRKTEGGA